MTDEAQALPVAGLNNGVQAAQPAESARLDAFDSGEEFRKAFEIAVADDAARTDYPTEEWASAGRKTKDKPNGEDAAWWLENGPTYVENWLTQRKNNGWITWDVDGEPAIELNINANIGPFLVRGSIDWIAVAGGELIICDKKSGSRTPDADLQLGIYACLVEKCFGERIRWGCYWMARKNEMTVPVDLDGFTLERLESQLWAFKRALDAQVFIPKVEERGHCKRCGVRDFCKFVNGPRAQEVE